MKSAVFPNGTTITSDSIVKGGINIQTFDVEFDDDDLLWQLNSRLVGILGAVTFYF